MRSRYMIGRRCWRRCCLIGCDLFEPSGGDAGDAGAWRSRNERAGCEFTGAGAVAPDVGYPVPSGPGIGLSATVV